MTRHCEVERPPKLILAGLKNQIKTQSTSFADNSSFAETPGCTKQREQIRKYLDFTETLLNFMHAVSLSDRYEGIGRFFSFFLKCN